MKTSLLASLRGPGDTPSAGFPRDKPHQTKGRPRRARRLHRTRSPDPITWWAQRGCPQLAGFQKLGRHVAPSARLQPLHGPGTSRHRMLESLRNETPLSLGVPAGGSWTTGLASEGSTWPNRPDVEFHSLGVDVRTVRQRPLPGESERLVAAVSNVRWGSSRNLLPSRENVLNTTEPYTLHTEGDDSIRYILPQFKTTPSPPPLGKAPPAPQAPGPAEPLRLWAWSNPKLSPTV